MSVQVSSPPVLARGANCIEADVDLGAIAHNVRLIRRVCAVPVMAVVKADAFGHGARQVARAALRAGACSLGVATIGEAIELRDAGIAAPILAWLYEPASPIAEALALGIQLAVSGRAQLDAVAAAAIQARPALPATIQLQADTGLHRGGCDPETWPGLLAASADLAARGIVKIAGIWSHLSYPSRPGHRETARQLARLGLAVSAARAAGLDGPVHLANSAAALAAPATRLDLVRAGLGCYGVEPCAAMSFGLRPAMRVTTHVAGLHSVRAGEGIGYDHTVRAARDMVLALVPAGYADGIPRQAPGRARLAVAGRGCRVTGRVSMDQLTLDVTGLDVNVGDEVTVLGSGPGEPGAADWSRWCDLVPHEMLTGLGNGPRICRTWSGQ